MMWWPLPRYSIWLLLIFSLARPVTAYSLPGCNSAGNFDMVQNQQPSLTCTGLKPQHNIYWSITDPSTQEEIRIANCEFCRSKCPPCSDPIAGYNVSRESNETTTLQFLNTSQVTDGSTIKCSAFLNHTKATCRLYVVPAYTISECRENALKVKDGMQTPIRCEGLLAAQNMYWIITYGNGTVSTVAECNACRSSPAACPDCYVTHSDFNVTRESNSSTLVVQNNVGQKDGATLRCSKKDNFTHDDCTLLVESYGFNLPECNTLGNFDIVQNQQPSLTCTGLTSNHTIYWSITDPESKNEIRIGECRNCGKLCPPCSSLVEGYNVSRQEGNTTLQFLNPALITDESRVVCSSVNYSTKTACTLFVVPGYTIPRCKAGVITVIENNNSPVVCEGLLPTQNLYWTITYGNGTVSTIAKCTYCRQSSTSCPSCALLDADFKVTRGPDSSTLVILTNDRQKDGATLRCSKRDNTTHDHCMIRVSSLKFSTAFPVAAVAGGVAGFVSVVVVVVVSVVVAKRMRSNVKESTSRDDMASSTNGAADTYDGLRLPDVGLPSVYSDIGQRPVSSASGADYIDLYHGLDMTEVGQCAEYSQLGQDT